jgi:membrane-bound metal-dependent hydrolase YbcI (DUF457 family)
MCARLPDQLEKRGPDQPDIKHRGCTHSCFAVFLSLLTFGFVAVVGISALVSHHLVLTDFWAKELCVFFLAFVLAIILHIIADSLTTRKVKMLWPDTQSVGLGLFSNGTPGEYLVLWGYIFLTGVLVGVGVFGF